MPERQQVSSKSGQASTLDLPPQKSPCRGVARAILMLLLFLWALVPAAPALAYQEITVEHGGTINGQVILQGEVPPPGFLPVYKNRDVCGERVPDESLKVGPNGEVKDVAVVLDGVLAGKPASPTLAVLDNHNCAFVPRVQTLTIGQTLELRNSDPILHDAHAKVNSGETLFNLGLPVWRRVQHELHNPGLVVVDCNVLHTWMRAYIIVTEHPYSAVTDAAGRFTLDQVPGGQYTLRLWHERLGELEASVSVSAGQEARVTLVYPQLPMEPK